MPVSLKNVPMRQHKLLCLLSVDREHRQGGFWGRRPLPWAPFSEGPARG